MNHEEALFSFYMHEAAAHPLAFLATVKNKTAPTYWEEFWGYYAALRMEDEDYVEKVYKKYIEEEEDGNDYYVLLGYDAFLDHINRPDNEECVPIGYDLLMTAKDRISPLLKAAFQAMHSLLPVEGDTLPVEENFYTQQLFVPQQFLSLDTIRESIDQTKSKEEWIREINFLSDRLEFFYVESMMHIPEGWEGMTHLDMTPFDIVEQGKPITCYGMWKEGRYSYRLCLDNAQQAPATLSLQQIKSMASFQTIALLLLHSINGAQEGPVGWE